MVENLEKAELSYKQSNGIYDLWMWKLEEEWRKVKDAEAAVKEAEAAKARAAKEAEAAEALRVRQERLKLAGPLVAKVRELTRTCDAALKECSNLTEELRHMPFVKNCPVSQAFKNAWEQHNQTEQQLKEAQAELEAFLNGV